MSSVRSAASLCLALLIPTGGAVAPSEVIKSTETRYCFECTQVIGYSQVGLTWPDQANRQQDGWYVADGVFESIIENDRWQLLWGGGAGVDLWQRPNYAGWNLPFVSPCKFRSDAPDRVVLSISGPYGADEDAWVRAIEATLQTIEQKIPSARQIILQPVVGGPGHATCPCVANCYNTYETIRASWQHKHIDHAIARVVVTRAGTTPQVVAGFSPEVRTCSDYQDGLGHLTPEGAAAAGRAIAEYYAGRRCVELPDPESIKVGYAIVTPSSGTASGLMVFETFGERRGTDTVQAGVLPAEMTTSAVLFVSTEGRLSRNLGVAVVNPGATDAAVTMTLRDNDGKVVATRTVTVVARRQIAQFVTEMFSDTAGFPRDVTGTLSLTSTTPFAVVGLRFRGQNFSTVPVMSLAPGGNLPQRETGVGGAGAVILPHFAAGGGWASQIVLANSHPIPITVRLDLYTKDGTPLITILNDQARSSFTSLTIPAGGVLVLSPRDVRGDDPF